MILGKKLVIVLPAYNAAKTLEQTYAEIPFDIVDDVILAVNASSTIPSQRNQPFLKKASFIQIVSAENTNIGGHKINPT